jgi:predicted DNA-binding transcriptional regulator YafY
MDRGTAFEKLTRMKWLIEKGMTGSAKKMEVSERTLYRLINELKEIYRMDIQFCYQSNSYKVVSPTE